METRAVGTEITYREPRTKGFLDRTLKLGNNCELISHKKKTKTKIM